MTRGSDDAHAPALQDDLIDVPTDARLLGAIRKSTPWLYAAVDASEPDLGPPTAPLEDEGSPEAAASIATMTPDNFDRCHREYPTGETGRPGRHRPQPRPCHR